MTDVLWLGLADCSDDYKCQPTGEILFKGAIDSVTIKDSVFLHTKMGIFPRYDTQLMLSGNTFSNLLEEKAVQAGVFISLPLAAYNTTINVHHCMFQNQFHWNPVDSVSNLFMSALLIRLLPPPNYPGSSNDIKIHVHNTTFSDNERALTFQGLLENILITDCVFQSNIAMHAGAGILLLLFTKTPVQITNSTFHSNAAGHFRTKNVRPPGPYFRYVIFLNFSYSNKYHLNLF